MVSYLEVMSSIVSLGSASARNESSIFSVEEDVSMREFIIGFLRQRHFADVALDAMARILQNNIWESIEFI
jgi:hypothetical protein